MAEVFLFEFQNEQRIIYHSPLNDHIFELSSNLEDKSYPDSQWQVVDITKQLGISAICEFYFLSGQDCHTICFQSKDHQEVGIIQRGKNSSWAWKLVAFPFAPMNSGPFSLFETSEVQYITYRSILDEIQELCYDKTTDQWSHRNLSRLFNLPKAFGEPKGIGASSWQMIAYPLQSALAVLYRSAYFPSPEWRYQLVQQIPGVTGELNIYSIRDAVEVVYLNTSSKIILMEYELMPDYSLKMNLLAADSSNSDPTGVTGNDWTLIAYRKSLDNKLGILFKSGGSQWKSIQLAEPQPKISGIPYVYSNGKEPVIIYRSDPDSILYLITRNANGSFQVTNLSQIIEVPLPISGDPIGFVGNLYHTIVYKSTIQKQIDRETIHHRNLIALTKKAGFRWKQHSFSLYKEPLKWVKKAVVYQVYLRCFSKEGNFKSLKENIPRLKDLGITVLYLLPFHPVGVKSRKGALGSPYAIRDYFSIDPNCGTLEDLQDLIQSAHAAGLKLLYDFVPNHTSVDSKLIEEHKEWFLYSDSGKLLHPIRTWIDVGQLNHKDKNVWPYMLNVLKYWSDIGFDGFRCDYVDGVPLTLWKEACNFVENIKPTFLLAEGWDPVYYQNGFDATYSWSTHKMIAEILIDRKDKSGRLVRQLLEQEQIEGYGKGLQLRFTTTHDENAFNSRSVESLDDPRYVQIALLLTFCLPGSIPTIFNGQEIGSRKRLSLFDTAHIEWQWDDDQRQWHDFTKALIHTRSDNEALIDGNARFVEADDNLLAFYRQKVDEKILVIINLSENNSKYSIPLETNLVKILGNASQTDREINLKGYQFYIGKSVIETEFVSVTASDEERQVKKSKTSEVVIL